MDRTVEPPPSEYDEAVRAAAERIDQEIERRFAAAADAQREVRERVDREIGDRLTVAVQAAVAKAESDRFKRRNWILALVGVIGLGGLGTAGQYLVERVVTEKLAPTVNDMDFVRLNSLALKLDLSDSFSNDEADAVMALLDKISGSDAVRARKDFRSTLGNILVSFASAGQSPRLDEIYEVYRPEILTTQIATEALLHHYGQQVVGRLEAPRGKDPSLEAFETLERIAPRHRLEELALYYRTMYAFSEEISHPSARIVRMIDRATDLRTADLTRYWREVFQRSRAENWQGRPDPEGREFERVVRAFLTEYAGPLAERYDVAAEQFRELGSTGVKKDLYRAAAEYVTERLKQPAPSPTEETPS